VNVTVERFWPCKFASVSSSCIDRDSLGGSGSGKTTLLNAIAHRIGGLPITHGEVGYYSAKRGDDGEAERRLSKSEVKKRVGFVRQQDFLVECLTG
jgi:ABC-type multidrug transport system ATPase subunit